MGLNWNEIKSRALLFSKTWADACNEDSQAKPFWIDFFEIFGITNKRVATFELNVKKLGGAQGFVNANVILTVLSMPHRRPFFSLRRHDLQHAQRLHAL